MKSSKTIEIDSKKQKRIIIIFALLVIAILLLFFAWKSFVTPQTTANQNSTENKMHNENAFPFKKEGSLTFLSTEGKTISTIDIETAENEEEQALGLMYRTSLNENQGMLFIFNIEENHSFWMKNTILPLDIIFVNANKEIIKIHKDTIPYQESPSYESGKPALYVVEVNGGYCGKFNIKEGDKISYTKF